MKLRTVAIATAAAASLAALSGCQRPDEQGATPSPGPMSETGRDASRPQPPMAAGPGTAEPPAVVSTPPAPGAPDTAAIEEKVKTAIARTGVDSSKIDVEAEGGRVTLKGEVPKQQIDRVVLIARSVPGVLSVDNQLRASGES
jgi:hypothetical protein